VKGEGKGERQDGKIKGKRGWEIRVKGRGEEGQVKGGGGGGKGGGGGGGGREVEWVLPTYGDIKAMKKNAFS